jgi:hypothetical protein
VSTLREKKGKEKEKREKGDVKRKAKEKECRLLFKGSRRAREKEKCVHQEGSGKYATSPHRKTGFTEKDLARRVRR